MGHLVSDLQKIAAWFTHELEKADVQSKIGLIAESRNGDIPSDVLNGVLRNKTAGARLLEQETSADVQERTGVTREPVKEVAMPAGSAYVYISDPATKLTPFGSTSPTSGFDQFYNSMMTLISSSYGVPLEVLHGRFSTSYSASRATLLLWWKSVTIARANHNVDFMVKIVEAWLTCEIAKSRIQAPGWSDPRQRKAWANFTLVCSNMPDIDPIKTVEGLRGSLELGLTTFERAAWEMNGTRFDENAERIKKESKNLTILPWHKNFLIANAPEEEPEAPAQPGDEEDKEPDESTTDSGQSEE
jgi:capsid protein